MEFKTNEFLKNSEIKSENLKSERSDDNYSIFVEYHIYNKISYGCRFSKKKTSKTTTRFDCSKCRQILDREKRKRKNDNMESAPRKDSSSYFIKHSDDIFEWKKVQHIDECILIEYGTEICRSHKNEAVVAKSKYNMTSKQAFDGQLKILLNSEFVTTNNINKGYKSFHKARSTLDKAKNRVDASTRSNFLDADNKILKENTLTTPTKSPLEPPEYFLIYESAHSGTIILGTKFMVEHFYSSKIVLSDGTFAVAPNGYAQLYILWFLIEDFAENDVIPRSKAVAAVYCLMKTKSQKDYDEVWENLEKFR